MSEPLHYLPPERWNELQSVFKKNWPEGVPPYSALKMQKQWLDKGIKTDFKVYCPFGKVENGMVVLNEKNGSYEVVIQCPNDDLDNLETALRKTQLIDWKRSITMPYTQPKVIELIKTLFQDIHMEFKLILPSATFVLDTKTPYENVNLPQDVSFKHLTKEYVDLVDSTWPHRYPNSATYFELLIENKYGYGLFLKDTLICWLLVNESGNLTHLYTVKEQRKKGYAELILKLVSNVLIEDGKIVSSFCLLDNVNAINLHTKAGFVRTNDIAWVFLKPTGKLYK